MAKYITRNGAIWKLSNNNFRLLARALKRTGECDLDHFGTLVIDRYYRMDEVVDEADTEVELGARVRLPRIRPRGRINRTFRDISG